MKAKKHYYFSLIHFQIKQLDVHLVLPQLWQAADLYQAIAHDRDQIGQWLPWAYQMHNVQDESKFIQKIQQDMLQQKMLVLTIIVNDLPCGMIDIHKIIPKQKGEIGYWLSSQYQKCGIMTKSVQLLCEYAFSELQLQYLDLLVAAENTASAQVAKHAGFKFMGSQEKAINHTQTGNFFRKINPN